MKVRQLFDEILTKFFIFNKLKLNIDGKALLLSTGAVNGLNVLTTWQLSPFDTFKVQGLQII